MTRFPVLTAFLLALHLSLQTLADPVSCHYFYEPLDDIGNITMDTPNSNKSVILEVLKQVMAGHVKSKQITPNSTVDAFLEFLETIDPYRIFISNEDLVQMKYPERNFFLFLHHRMSKGIVTNEYKKLFDLSQQRLAHYAQKFVHEFEFRQRVVNRANQRLTQPSRFNLSERPETISAIEDKIVDLLAKYLAGISKSKNEAAIRTDRGDLADLIRAMRSEVNEHRGNVNPDTLNQIITKSYLKTFDQHTDMLLRSNQQDFQDSASNERTIVGIIYHPIHDAFKIDYVAAESVAEKAGIRQGDVILAIEETKNSGVWRSTRSLSLEDFKRRLWGEKGSEFRLRIRRDNQDIVYDLSRKTATAGDRSVESKLVETTAGTIVQLKLSSFSEGSAMSLREEIAIKQKEKNIKGVVLDLRGNPGGSIRELTEILEIFVDNPISLIIKYNNQRSEHRSLRPEKPIWKGPLVVLVDHASASSSEGLAAALTAYRRAIVVGGPRTYGKGTIQNYSQSSEGATYKATTALFFSPDGRAIQWNGAAVDITLPRTDDGQMDFEHSGPRSLRPETLSGRLPKISPVIPDLNLIIEIAKDQSADRIKQPDSTSKSLDNIEAQNTEEAIHILKDWINLE